MGYFVLCNIFAGNFITNSKRMKILGIGNALVDLLIQLESDFLLETLRLPRGSMQLIDESKYLKIIDQVENYNQTTACGGSAANVVCGTAKLGVGSAYCGKVCNDSYGKFYKKDLLTNGVDPLLFESNIATGCATTFISKDGERTFGTYLGAAALLDSDDMASVDFKAYDWILIEGYLIVLTSFFEEILKRAKAAGCKVSIDLASYNVVRDNLSLFKKYISKYADMVFANEEEAYEYTGLWNEEAAEAIGKEVSISVVKVGSKGSYVYHNNRIVSATATPSRVLDTTGAGDLYAAGFFYGLEKGYDLKRCAEIGSIVAGKVIEVIGTKMDDQRWTEINKEIKQLSSYA